MKKGLSGRVAPEGGLHDKLFSEMHGDGAIPIKDTERGERVPEAII